MKNRSFSFVALLAVIALSIVFGMVLGDRLNAPPTALAWPGVALGANSAPLQLLPALTDTGGVRDFADVVEQCLPAVVGVANTQSAGSRERRRGDRQLPDPWHWFFGEPDSPQQREMRERPRTGYGSGFIVSPDGYILTNNHVVQDADRLVVRTQDGREHSATVVGADPAIDLALLKIDNGGAQLPALPLGDSERLRVGQWVIAIGNPLEFEQTVTVGVVSAKERQVPLENTDSSLTTFIQTDAAINFGNSGGPLIDAAGNVVGINTAIRRGNLAEGIGFALPINQARNAMEQLLRSGRVDRGFLGINLLGQGLTEAAAEYYGLPDSNGALVQDVTPGHPADRAGVRKGDVIRKVDGKPVRDNRDLIRKISSRRPGESVELELIRDGKTITRTAKLMERGEALEANARRSGSSPEREEGEPDEARGLGATVENLTPSLRARLDLADDVRGVVVVQVDLDSPLADVGVAPQSVIVSVNDKPMRDVDDWDRVVNGMAPGTPLKLEVVDFRINDGSSRYVFVKVPRKD